jgi:hypothetical protein
MKSRKVRRKVYVARIGKEKIVAGFTLESPNERDHCEE